MEQSTLSDSTRMPAAQVETRDHAQEARVAALLAAPSIDPGSDGALLALGRELDVAIAAEHDACARADAAVREAGLRKTTRPACLIFGEDDAPLKLRQRYEHPAALVGSPVREADVDWMRRRMPMQHEVLRPIREGERAHIDHPGHKFEIVPHPEAQARAEEIIAAWQAWGEAVERINAECGVPEAEAVAENAGEAASAIAFRIAELPARTAEGLRAKLRALIHYDPNALPIDAPEEPDPGQVLARSIRLDLARIQDEPRATQAPPVAHPDPIFAAIEKDRALAAEHIRLLGISGSKPDEDPSWEPTHDASDALWAHWDDVLLKTVPTTASGCAALARYVNEWSEREGLDLSEAGPKIFDLIGRSPLLQSAAPSDAAEPDPIFAALDACRAPEAERKAFHAVHSVGKTGPGYTFERETALDDAVDAAFGAVFATTPTTRAGRLALTAFIERRIEWSACPDGSPQEGEDTVFADAYRALARVIEAEVPEVAGEGIAEALHRAVDLKALDIKDLSHLALWTESLITMASGLAQRGGRRPLGRFFDQVSNALCDVVVEAQDELRARTPADALEREYRAKTIALPVIENGDADELESLIADLQVEVAYLRQPMTAEAAR